MLRREALNVADMMPDLDAEEEGDEVHQAKHS